MSIIESHSVSLLSELSWFSSSCLLVHVPITIFLNVMNNLQLLSSSLHYNSCTKRRDQIKTKSLYCHNTMNARVQVGESLLCKLSSMTVRMTNIEYIMQHIYMYTYGLNTCREQYMVNIILCREHEMKTIINTITVHIRAARYLA